MPKPDKWLTLESHTLATYNAWDTVATALLARELTRELDRTKQLQFYRDEVWSNLPAVLAMQQRGLPYDTKAKGIYRRRLNEELDEVDALIRSDYTRTLNIPPEVVGDVVARFVAWLFPTKKNSRRSLYTKTDWDKVKRWTTDGFNINSDQQIRHWLFTTLGLRQTTKTKGGVASVDQDALNRLLQRKPATKADAEKIEAATPIILNLMHRAKLATIDSTYLDPVVTNGRVYPTIKMLGTETGRFAYQRPAIHSWSGEPKYKFKEDTPDCYELSPRHLVKAPPGYAIVSADMKAIESRVFTLLTGDPKDQLVFTNNVKYPKDPQWDIHIQTACSLFSWSLEEYLAKGEDLREGSRNTAKTFRYGVIQYGGKPESAKTKTYCPCPKCKDKVPPTATLTAAEKKRQADRWFANHPEARRYRERTSEEVMRTGRLRNPFGQIRFFHSPWGEDTEREAWNWPIQSSATIILRRGMRRLHAIGAPIILEHHDALYLEVKENEVDYWVGALRAMLEEPVSEFGGVSFPAECKVGASWGELAKV